MREPSQKHTQRLLVLDDDELVCFTICTVGRLAGYECRYTTVPAEFFDLLQEWPADVLALDLLMPGMDGMEVLSRLSAARCDADIIITSGVNERVLDAAQRSASEQGLRTLGVLSKPFSSAQLTQLLETNRPAPGNMRRDGVPENSRPTAKDLRHAIESGHIRTVYQPKVSCRSGALVGFEALARWQWRRVPVPPDYFVPLAENNGLVNDLSEAVIGQALNWFAAVSEQSVDHPELGMISLSVNLSARSLADEALVPWIIERCETLRISKERIVLELTETSATDETATALETLTRLRLQGFQLSIDDFGTGYSSMAQLVRLPFTEIKVDKSFVLASKDSAIPRSVVKSIIELGHSLGMQATAEGVESAATMTFLRELGCDFAQGYHVAAPLPAAEVLPWIVSRDNQLEAERLEAVASFQRLTAGPEREVDRITTLSARLFDVPVALVTVLDEHREWFKSRVGLNYTELPREQSFCTHTIGQDGLMVVPDATTDERFQSLDIVQGEEQLRFYAGKPVFLPGGEKIGALCLLGHTPRLFSVADGEALSLLAGMVEQELGTDPESIHDNLTGLLLRSHFRVRALSLLELARKTGHHVHLHYVTLYDLTEVNRRHGRVAGDRCLEAVSRALLRQTDASDLAGRYRGSELVTLRLGSWSEMVFPVGSDLKNQLARTDPQVAEAAGLRSFTVRLRTPTEDELDYALEKARVGVTRYT